MHSTVTEPGFHISVFSTHTLENDEQKTEMILPRTLDSRIIRSVHFSFSGTVDHSTPVLPNDMLSSSVVQFFRHHLSLNAEHLGIIEISQVILDDHPSSTFGIPKVFVTPARCPCLGASHAHVLSIHLAYNWKSFSQTSSGLSIFSPQTLIPLKGALEKLMHKLFSVHIVGHYPWLFGPLRTKLHLEHRWFPPLVRSLLAITDRSGNPILRNRVKALVKAEALAPSVPAETDHYPQEITTRASLHKLTTGSPSAGTSDTLISALELVLKTAARPPPSKGARLHTASTQPSSNDDTLDLHELPHPSEDVPGNAPYLVDLLPTDPCLSVDPWAHQFDDNISSGDSEEIAAGNGELDSTSQFAPSECAGHIFSDILPPTLSNWDPRIDEEDEFTSCDVSPPPLPMGEPWTGTSGLKCPAPHEDLIDLDDDLDVPSDDSDLCTFDDAKGDDAMMLAFE